MAFKPFSSAFCSDVAHADRERFPELFRKGPMADRHKATRVVPMKVMVFGLMRTGTSSVRVALSRMEFNDVYHMTSVFHDPDDAAWWLRAGDAKWKNKGTFSQNDWDRLLGHCQAVCDIPPAAFAEELIAAYPEAKVVILNRDVDKWYESVTSTVAKASQRKSWAVLRQLINWREYGQVNKVLRQEMHGMFGPNGMTEDNMKRFFREYHENIRRIVPSETLLEFKVQDGYKPLCEFLEVPIPTTTIGGKQIEEPFPRVNERAMFGERLAVVRRLQNKRIMEKAVVFVGIVAAAGAGLWCLSRW